VASRSVREKGLSYAVVAPFAILLAFPFFWMIITTFKQTNDLYNVENVPFLFNDPPTTEHARFLLFDTDYLRWLWNSGFVGVVVVALTLLLALPAGYSLARLTGRVGQGLGVGIFLTYLVPPTLLFIPLSRVIANLGLQDSLWSLVLVYPSFTIPFSTWLLMGFFRTVGRDIEEAALVDGCTRFQAMWRVMLPLSVPGILTVVIFTFSLTINEFVYALTFISSSAEKTISVGVPTDLIRGDVFFWGSLMAGALIPSIPLALLYNAFLDRFIKGFTGGTVG